MRTIKTNTQADLQLEGVTVELETEGADAQYAQINAIKVTDKNGKTFTARCDYGFKISIPAPPTTKRVFRVEGVIDDFPVVKDFELESEADEAIASYGPKLKVTPVDVVVVE